MLTEINIHLSAWIVSCARPPPIVLLCPGYLTWVSTYSKYVSYIHLKHHQTSEKTGTGASIHPLSLYLLQVCFQSSARRFVPVIVPLSCLDRGRTNMERSIRSLPAQTVTGHSLRPSVHVSRSPAFTKHPIDDNRVGMAGLIVILKRYTAPAYTSLGTTVLTCGYRQEPKRRLRGIWPFPKLAAVKGGNVSGSSPASTEQPRLVLWVVGVVVDRRQGSPRYFVRCPYWSYFLAFLRQYWSA